MAVTQLSDITQTEFETIVRRHRLYMETKGASGVAGRVHLRNLQKISLKGHDVTGMDFSGSMLPTNVSGVNFNGCILRAVRFVKLPKSPRPNLSGANFNNTNLTDTNFSGCDMRGVNMRGVILSRTNFSDADLSGANIAAHAFSTFASAYRGIRDVFTREGIQKAAPFKALWNWDPATTNWKDANLANAQIQVSEMLIGSSMQRAQNFAKAKFHGQVPSNALYIIWDETTGNFATRESTIWEKASNIATQGLMFKFDQNYFINACHTIYRRLKDGGYLNDIPAQPLEVEENIDPTAALDRAMGKLSARGPARRTATQVERRPGA